MEKGDIVLGFVPNGSSIEVASIKQGKELSYELWENRKPSQKAEATLGQKMRQRSRIDSRPSRIPCVLFLMFHPWESLNQKTGESESRQFGVVKGSRGSTKPLSSVPPDCPEPK